jgi:CSLREA domain-containing protein
MRISARATRAATRALAALGVSVALLGGALGPPVAAQPAGFVFTVDSVDDGDDVNIGDGRCAASNDRCTLRAAIREVNA